MKSWLKAALLLSLSGACRAPSPESSEGVPSPALQVGIVVELHPRASERFGLAYPPSLARIEALGFDHITLPMIAALPSDGDSIRRSLPSNRDLRAVAREARKRGLEVVLLPLLAVEGSSGAWRGTLRPADEDRFWVSYGRLIEAAASLATKIEARRLYIGSELNHLAGGGRTARWCRVAESARRRFAGELAYALHHAALHRRDPVPCVDVLGINAWFPLTRDPEAAQDELRRGFARAWAPVARFARRVSIPVVISELGYPSIDGAALAPWADRRGGFLDLEEQRRAYAAALTTVARSPWLSGLTVWSAFGPGGPQDRGFSPLGKPAEGVLRRFLEDLPPNPSPESSASADGG